MVAVLPDDARQALALPRRLVAGAADGEVGVAAAALAAVRSEVPEAGHAAVALLPDHARFAAALPSLEVALRKIVRLLGSTIEVYLANKIVHIRLCEDTGCPGTWVVCEASLQSHAVQPGGPES